MERLSSLLGISPRQGPNAPERANKPPTAVVGRPILNNLHNPPAINSGDLRR